MPSRVSAMNVDKARLANDFSKMQSQSKHNKRNVDSLKRTVRRLQLKVCLKISYKFRWTSKAIRYHYKNFIFLLVKKTWSAVVKTKCSFERASTKAS